jgi:sulfur carrier protein
MQIYINGKTREVPDATTMSVLVELLELGGQRIAVEVNEELVPRSRFAEHRLVSADKVEVIHAVGGG